MDGNSGINGYRVFCNEHIQNVKEKIELETGKKANISSLQKELSKLWNELTEEERQVIKNIIQICREKAQSSGVTKDVKSNKRATKKPPSISPFQNYRIKNILSLDPKMPKFTSSSITLINDAMAAFLEQLAQLTDRYVVKMGGNYPIKPQHIVGGIDQGDDSVSFLKESIEYVHKDKSNEINRDSIKRTNEEEIAHDVDNSRVESCKITTYFKQKT